MYSDGGVDVTVLLDPGPLLYLGTGRSGLSLRSAPESSASESSAPVSSAPVSSAPVSSAPVLSTSGEPARLLLLGGEPFAEELVMWWNFVGRSHDDIASARAEWESGLTSSLIGRFGKVTGFDGDALPAPALPTTRLRPRGRARPDRGQ